MSSSVFIQFGIYLFLTNFKKKNYNVILLWYYSKHRSIRTAEFIGLYTLNFLIKIIIDFIFKSKFVM